MNRAYVLSLSSLLAAFLIYLAFGTAFSAPAQETNTGQFVLQAQVPLVIVDVVVTDKKGQPIHGLKESDFTVLEKGEQMKVDSFEEHRVDEAPPGPPVTMPALPPNVFTNIVHHPTKGPLNILLLDALNTPMKDQMYVRQQMISFLKKLPEGTPIAIFGLSSRLYILQGFTTDPAVLKAALNSKKGLPHDSVLTSIVDQGPTMEVTTTNMQDFMGDEAANMANMKMQITLDAMDIMGRYLAALPGRKNLIWFSGSFLNIIPDGDLADSTGSLPTFSADLKSTAQLLSRAQVAVYPVDGRGLFSDATFSASQPSTRAGVTAAGLQNINNTFFTKTATDRVTMNMMAEQTGGKAFYNTNDLKGAVQDAISEGSNYYTLTYTPTNRQWDTNYRSIRVKVDQPGVELSYRHGYFAENPDIPRDQRPSVLSLLKKGTPAPDVAPPPPPPSPMETAMMRGAPDPTQILMHVQIEPMAGPEDTLSKGNKPDEKRMKPPYRHYKVYYAPIVRNLTFTPTPEGTYRGSFEFVTVLYDPDGGFMNSITSAVNLNFAAAKYNQMLHDGLVLSQVVDAPAKGEYFLRFGVHDKGTDHVGAVEVPLAAIQLVSAPPAALRK